MYVPSKDAHVGLQQVAVGALWGCVGRANLHLTNTGPKLSNILVYTPYQLVPYMGPSTNPQQAAHCGLMRVCLGQCPHTNPKQAPLLDNLLFVCLFGFYRTSENKYSKTSQYSFSFHQYYSTNKVN